MAVLDLEAAARISTEAAQTLERERAKGRAGEVWVASPTGHLNCEVGVLFELRVGASLQAMRDNELQGLHQLLSRVDWNHAPPLHARS